MKIEWTKSALANLQAIAEYLAQEDEQAARRMTDRIREAVSLLGRHPGLGRPGRVPGTRELVVTRTPYIVPYRVRNEVVEVLRVFHSARKWPRAF